MTHAPHPVHSRAGVKIKCRDGCTRTVVVRVLGFSGDAPELKDVAACAGLGDAALDAGVGSDEHLFAYAGGAPTCACVPLASCCRPSLAAS